MIEPIDQDSALNGIPNFENKAAKHRAGRFRREVGISFGFKSRFDMEVWTQGQGSWIWVPHFGQATDLRGRGGTLLPVLEAYCLDPRNVEQ